VLEKLKTWVCEEVFNVFDTSGVEIINTENIITGFKQPIAEMRAEEPSAASDKDAFGH
jgi:hypothetical protein